MKKLQTILFTALIAANCSLCFAQIPATRLWNDFKENEAAANKEYKHRTITVSGEVVEIGSRGSILSIDVGYYALLKVGVMSGIMCYFPLGESSAPAKIRKGEFVELCGICTGFDASKRLIVLEKCKTPEMLKREAEKERRAQIEREEREKELAKQRAEEERLAREAAEKERQYQAAIGEAEKLFEAKNYDKAIAAYRKAKGIKPQNAPTINPEIAKIEKIQEFLSTRDTAVYDYSVLNATDYQRINSEITEDLKTMLLQEKQEKTATVDVTGFIDINGQTATTLETSVSNEALKFKMQKISNDNRFTLKQQYIYDYSVAAKALFKYSVESSSAVVSLKKNSNGIESNDANFNIYRSIIDNGMKSAPFGEYKLDINRAYINGTQYGKSKVLQSKVHGPSNAFLSLLVPGLGDSRVSYGAVNGTGTAVFTYGLIGAGVGCKMYSNSEYKKYHAATTQEAMDDHYKKANYSNQAFYGCVITGGLIWLYDIIWVWKTGSENVKAQKQFRNSHIGLYSEPASQSTGLSYTLNF
jgi:hypothetical protein